MNTRQNDGFWKMKTLSHSQPGEAGSPLPLLSRRRLLWGIGCLSAGVLLLPGCKQISSLAQAEGQTYVVELKDFFFDPIGLTLKRADTVIWIEAREQVKTPHTATAYHPNFDKVLRIPEGAPAWDSGFFEEPDQTFTHTFQTRGIHDYFCIPHEDSGMVGRILVETPTGPGAQPLSVGISAAGQSVMPFVDELQGAPGEVFNVQGRLNAVMLPWRLQDRTEALARWKTLLAEIETLLPQFLAQLGEADRQAVAANITTLNNTLNTETSLFPALAAVDDLKLFLEQLAYA